MLFLLPGDERVYCVDPMGGSHVLPVGTDFREFVSFLRDANPLSPLSWLGEEAFRELLREDRETGSSLGPEVLEKREQALAALAEVFRAESRDPFEAVKALQKSFDPSALVFFDAYDHMPGRESSRGTGPQRNPDSRRRPVWSFAWGEERDALCSHDSAAFWEVPGRVRQSSGALRRAGFE